jgi:hypothetical protein
MGGWRGLVYPRGVPEQRVARMEQAVLEIARGERFAGFMQASGFQRDVADGRQFAAFLDRMDSDFGDILQQPAMKQQALPPIGAYWMPAACGALLVSIAGFGWITSRSGGEVEPAEPSGTDGKLLSGVLASLLGFLMLYESLGYVLSCGLLLAVLLTLLKVRWPVTALLVCVLVPTTYQVFSGLLGVPLPWGVLGW